MSERVYNVLFLCTGNSARSIIAEAVLNHEGRGRFHGHSAGSYPSGQVNPLVLDFLRRHGISTEGAWSKSWDEFAKPGAPRVDFVITVCDQAAGETCPVWPGRPITAHWGVEDPAAFMADPEKAKQVIGHAFHTLRNRIVALVNLPLDALDQTALQNKLRDIGRSV